MNFTTKISIPKSKNPIHYNSKIVLLGSCFSENIGLKFDYFKFQNVVNPFGIIFNPIAIENLIFRALLDQKFTEDDVFFHDGLWKCFEVHSDLNLASKERYILNLNKILSDFRVQINQATHVIITFGTAWVYSDIPSKKVVANCHKVVQNQFDKQILSVEIIAKSIQNTVDLISKINPNCNVIFTVSPVRHLKDGFVGNTQSKAYLFAGMHQIMKITVPNMSYFPSYEITMDELRDYRFYADDMLHLNKIAIDFIWERFSETYFSQETILISNQIEALQKELGHLPINTNSESHLKFLAGLKLKISNFSNKYPTITF